MNSQYRNPGDFVPPENFRSRHLEFDDVKKRLQYWLEGITIAHDENFQALKPLLASCKRVKFRGEDCRLEYTFPSGIVGYFNLDELLYYVILIDTLPSKMRESKARVWIQTWRKGEEEPVYSTDYPFEGLTIDEITQAWRSHTERLKEK